MSSTEISDATNPPTRLPSWLRRSSSSVSETRQIKKLLRRASLNTVCEEARCPNIAECFGRGTATFMILGDICTRGCRFCSVTTGKPEFGQLDIAVETRRLVEAVRELSLDYVVITSVARDDLDDGGASAFASAITAINTEFPDVAVEVLTPDFRGNLDVVKLIVDAGPAVFNHNLETVARLYRRVRPGASVERSLELLLKAKEYSPEVLTKTGLMMGLGEEKAEVIELMKRAVDVGVDIFTLGQYMRPTTSHLQVERYLSPDEFEEYREIGDNLGFRRTISGPLVRSSYYAESALSLIGNGPNQS